VGILEVEAGVMGVVSEAAIGVTSPALDVLG
jgi:hypothetical protein